MLLSIGLDWFTVLVISCESELKQVKICLSNYSLNCEKLFKLLESYSVTFLKSLCWGLLWLYCRKKNNNKKMLLSPPRKCLIFIKAPGPRSMISTRSPTKVSDSTHCITTQLLSSSWHNLYPSAFCLRCIKQSPGPPPRLWNWPTLRCELLSPWLIETHDFYRPHPSLFMTLQFDYSKGDSER